MSVLGGGLRLGLRELVTAARNKSLATRMTKRCGARSDELLLGGRYEVERLIGRGSHGLVFAANDRALEREVAIKVFGLASDQDIYNEARALACVNHPNVVALHDVGRADGCTYLVMALIDGWTIAERVQMGLDWRAVVELFIAGGRGLAAVHRAGVVHGDVKPNNVLVGRDGTVCIADFGLSRRFERVETEQLGTREYLAPECWAGAEASPFSDQFSYCVALWESLYGTRPWASDIVSARLEKEPEKLRRRADIPAQLEHTLRRGLASEPHDRHADMRALIDELEDALQWGST